MATGHYAAFRPAGPEDRGRRRRQRRRAVRSRAAALRRGQVSSGRHAARTAWRGVRRDGCRGERGVEAVSVSAVTDGLGADLAGVGQRRRRSPSKSRPVQAAPSAVSAFDRRRFRRSRDVLQERDHRRRPAPARLHREALAGCARGQDRAGRVFDRGEHRRGARRVSRDGRARGTRVLINYRDARRLALSMRPICDRACTRRG
jgi:hypothetical protein